VARQGRQQAGALAIEAHRDLAALALAAISATETLAKTT